MKESVVSEHKEVIGEPAPYFSVKMEKKKKRGIFKSLCWHIGKFFISLSDN